MNGLWFSMFAVVLSQPSGGPASETERPPAGFAVWGTTVPAPWDSVPIPPGWKRVTLKDDPWRHIGPVNTVMPPLTDLDRERGWVAYGCHYADPVLPESAPTPEQLTALIEVFACPGEYEPLSFCVRGVGDAAATGRNATTVRVTVSSLEGEHGQIPLSRLDLRVVRYMPIPFGSPEDKTYALRPVLLERRETVDIPADTTVRFWITVKVPETATPGLYSGTVVVQSPERPAASLTVRLRVLPIKLERPPTAYAFYHLLTKSWKHYGHDQPDTLLRHCVDMSEHGMNSVAFYTLPRIERNVERNLFRCDDGNSNERNEFRSTSCVGTTDWRVDFDRAADSYPHSFAEQIQAYRGAALTQRMVWYLGDLNLTLKPFSLAGGTREMEQAYTAVTRQVEAWRKEHDVPEIFYSPHDEIDASAQRTQDALFYLRMLKGLGVRTFQTYIGMKDRRKESLPAVDAASFAGDAFRAEFVHETKLANKELWTYSGNARYGLDPKGDRYFFGLFSVRASADGVAQWAYQWPPGSHGDASPYDMLAAGVQGWNYAFPAPDGLLPTIGLEGIREGIDDAKYVHTLRQWIARARQSGKPGAMRLADAADQRLADGLRGIDINENNVHFLDDFPQYTAANEQTCHKQPDSMRGADFDRLRWQWAQDILAIEELLR